MTELSMVFSARQHIHIARPSVCLSRGWISQNG